MLRGRQGERAASRRGQRERLGSLGKVLRWPSAPLPMARPTAQRTRPAQARTGARVAGFALALALLLAQAASRLHRAEVAHRLCAEHGTLEHAPSAHLRASAPDAHGQSRVPVRVEPAGDPEPASDAHAACELAELLNAGQAAPPSVALAPSAVPPAAVLATANTAVRPREVRGRRESARGPPRAA